MSKNLMTLYVHASRESAYSEAEKIGLEGEALKCASFTGYEHKMLYEVDENGDSKLIEVDDRKLANGESGH